MKRGKNLRTFSQTDSFKDKSLRTFRSLLMTNTTTGAIALTKISAFRLLKNKERNKTKNDYCKQQNYHDTTYDDCYKTIAS
ncbi:MAG: hypothetical protein U0103_24600 [Candidatus Obscuribacterales bacterium]